MRLEYQDDIDRYLLGRMSDEERVSFENKCAGDPELKEQLEHTQIVKAVIAERSKMLEKIQKWDDEYDKMNRVTRKKNTWLYWVSGIAAVIVVGLMLFPNGNTPDSNMSGELISMSQDQQCVTTGTNVQDSSAKVKEPKYSLDKNDDKDGAEKHIAKPEDNQVLSFEMAGIGPANTQEQTDELKQIEKEQSTVAQGIVQLCQQLHEGEISQEFYDSSIGLLRYKRDQLSWRKALVLLDLGQRNEAMEILNEMRRAEGAFRSRADSLYNVIKE